MLSLFYSSKFYQYESVKKTDVKIILIISFRKAF